MKSILLLTVTTLLLMCSASSADSPDENTIPVVGLKAAYDDIDTEFLCLLSWHYFDGLSRQWYEADSILAKVVLPADTVGMLTVVGPWNLTSIIQWYSRMFPMSSNSAYARPGWDGYVINDSTVCSSDTIINSMSAASMETYMENVAEELEELFNQDSHSVWFYYGYDEAPAWQWKHMMNDSGIVHYDNYMPNLFTMEMDSTYRPELNLSSDSLWQPTFNKVDSLGVLSWMAWHIHEADSTREMSYITSCLHTIAENEWADYSNIPTDPVTAYPGTPAVQATSIRALFSMKYQEYEVVPPYPDPIPNSPSFIALDAYPFRLIGTQYQSEESYTPSLGSSLENWMIDHYEECMDSTFIPAWQIRNLDTLDADVFFVPQAFGRAGGTAMWSADSLLYESYAYRIPTPQEFRMQCNSALLRGATAILPYCLTSYMGGDLGDVTDAGLLDENNIPFDAPYEEWVYTSRPTDSITYINPDAIPPFMNGYDPLYTLPLRPDTSGAQGQERLLEWKFAAYGRLWHSVRRTFADIARVAPELALLDWWEDHEDLAELDYDGIQPSPFLGAQVRVFTDENEDHCFLYYLNRYCRANGNPYEITIDAGDFPAGTPFSEYALDHSRRFLVQGDMISRDVYQFLDTLDAGEGRLLQIIDDGDPLPWDIRITDPDVFVILPADSDTLADYQSCSGEPVNIHARFYNMGMDSLSNLLVYLEDETDDVMLDTARVSFSGLSTDSCYRQDRDEAVFTWTPDSTDIGVHRLRVFTEYDPSEPDTADNDARLVYVVEPRDYATQVLSDPWDMTEPSPPIVPPVWNTFDIDSLTGTWGSYTDSISGMFEGTLPHPDSSNGLYLNVGSGSENWIDADLYSKFSMYGYSSGAAASIRVHWTDRYGNGYYVNTGESISSPADRTDPVDLSSLSNDWTGMVSSIWIEFTGTNLPTDIRIGWVRLTE